MWEKQREAAKERQKEHGGTAPGKPKTLVAALPQVFAGKTRDKVAEPSASRVEPAYSYNHLRTVAATASSRLS